MQWQSDKRLAQSSLDGSAGDLLWSSRRLWLLVPLCSSGAFLRLILSETVAGRKLFQECLSDSPPFTRASKAAKA